MRRAADKTIVYWRVVAPTGYVWRRRYEVYAIAEMVASRLGANYAVRGYNRYNKLVDTERP